MISYFVMGKPEILHSSQLPKAFRPRSQISVGTQTLVTSGGRWWRSGGEKNAISSVCWSVLRHVEIDLREKNRREDPSRDFPTSPIFTDSSMMFCSRTSWFQEEFAEPNTIGIVAILHTLSCKRIRIVFGQFSRGISMIFDVISGPKAMKWDDQLPCFFSVSLGHMSTDDQAGSTIARWCLHTTSHTGQRAIIYSKLHRFSGLCNYKTEMSICNVIPATQNVLNVLQITSCGVSARVTFSLSAWDFDLAQELLQPTLVAAMMPKKHIHMDT